MRGLLCRHLVGGVHADDCLVRVVHLGFPRGEKVKSITPPAMAASNRVRNTCG